MMKYYWLIYLLLLVAACQDQDSGNAATVQAPKESLAQVLDTIIKNGDLVLRSDNDMVGLTLRNMNDSDKTYSHSGFAFKEQNNWFVYNMMAGEENPSLRMRRDSLHLYIDPNQKSGFAIYRYDISISEADSLHRLLQQQHQQHLIFDTAFNIADDTAMYCSEMIAKNILKASNGRIKIPTTHKENFSFKATTSGRSSRRNLTYFAIDNLYLNNDCRLVLSKKYY